MSEPKPVATPPKAYRNEEFLTGGHAREIRILCELVEPKARLAAHDIHQTIIFFGSARIPSPEVADLRLQQIEAKLEAMPGRAELKRQLAVARRLKFASKVYNKCRTLARMLAEWSNAIPDPRERFTICTGGGPGLMEACNRGAFDAGARNIGLGISLPFEPEHNPFITPELLFEFHYFMIRKYWFASTARAMVVCPGGFGTMDELFELLTLMQTGKSPRIPTVLLDREFWEKAIGMDALIEWGVIGEDDLELFRVLDTPEEAFEYITASLTTPNQTGGTDEQHISAGMPPSYGT